MKIKSFVWYWLAMACFVVGLLYGMGLEGSFQTGAVRYRPQVAEGGKIKNHRKVLLFCTGCGKLFKSI